MLRFLVYWLVLSVSIGFYVILSGYVLDELDTLSSPFVISAMVINLIFTFKFLFIRVTARIRNQNSAAWVHSELIAFAAKFILIIGFLFALSRLYGEASKNLMLWTAILYCVLLIPDFIFGLKNRVNPKS